MLTKAGKLLGSMAPWPHLSCGLLGMHCIGSRLDLVPKTISCFYPLSTKKKKRSVIVVVIAVLVGMLVVPIGLLVLVVVVVVDDDVVE